MVLNRRIVSIRAGSIPDMRIKVKINQENKWDMKVDVYVFDFVLAQDIYDQVSLCVYD